jgi:hypothetical protein
MGLRRKIREAIKRLLFAGGAAIVFCVNFLFIAYGKDADKKRKKS